jgi:hypothetical protein
MDIPGAFAKRPYCGNCRLDCSNNEQQPQQPQPKKPRTPKPKPQFQFQCPSCGKTQQKIGKTININGIRLAVSYDHRFRPLFAATNMDLSDPDCKVSVCGTCYHVCSETLKLVRGIFPNMFSNKTVIAKQLKSTIIPQGTIWLVPDYYTQIVL